ncbi:MULTISPECIES: TraR/DksA family transcriptional regulator [Thermomonosporaceae]|uniref:TraR/DksA family transcriptional regulator n=1 Tax=Thermomonosporaceae TaxID=2012 RepID=UPI00255A9148|nr:MULTISPECIES: TraR/DksA C4-type zinc finger protein [Thermomonosporaceae]MDL4776900.1 TraR/DksA C4-type zinc finger protein [Actinomadura xylanilytica]
MGESGIDRERVRAVLAAERERTLARIGALARDRAGIVESASLVAVDDEHDPEGVTLGFERAHVESLLAGAERRLRDLDGAAARLEEGTYGRCAECGAQIGAGRLEARPEASRCIACASRRA